jgi:hypothetical protein
MVIVPLHLFDLPLATSDHFIVLHFLSQRLKGVVCSVTVLLHSTCSCELNIQCLLLSKRMLEIQLILFELSYFKLVVPHFGAEKVPLLFKVFSLSDILMVVLFYLHHNNSFQLLQVFEK